MSSKAEAGAARVPKRERGRQRVAGLLSAATHVFAEKGYDAATMTEIAARAGAPIGSLYQFFPAKEILADTLVQAYVTALTADLAALEARAAQIDTSTLVGGLFGLMRSHPEERAAAQPLLDRMDHKTRRATFRPVLRRQLAAILRARAPALPAQEARDMAVVLLALMKAGATLMDEEGLAGGTAAQNELRALAISYLEGRLGAPRT